MIPPGAGAPRTLGSGPLKNIQQLWFRLSSGPLPQTQAHSRWAETKCVRVRSVRERTRGPWAAWKAPSGHASSWARVPAPGPGAGWHFADGGAPPPQSPLFLCRMFFGKNKVMMVALGRSPSDEYKDNLHQVGARSHWGRGRPDCPPRSHTMHSPATVRGGRQAQLSFSLQTPHSALQVLPNVGGAGAAVVPS